MTAAPTIKIRTPRPIIKSAGGKTKLLPELLKLVPEKFERYYEPFVGGGALFFELAAQDRIHGAMLGDNNAELVNLYAMVKELPADLIRALFDRYGEGHESRPGELIYAYEKETYYKIRAWDPSSLGKISRAARFMYLNKTCFNGLWRVNKRGFFNVPMGRYTNPTICDEEGILAASRVLQDVELHTGDFEDVLNVHEPEAGDVVYLDPPYDPLDATDSFTGYTKEDFTWKNQIRLYVHARYLARMGVKVIASNADTGRIRELWGTDFETIEVDAARAINSHAEKRGKITELIFHNQWIT